MILHRVLHHTLTMTIAVDRTWEMQKTSESEGVYWYSKFFLCARVSLSEITGGPGVAGLINYVAVCVCVCVCGHVSE